MAVLTAVKAQSMYLSFHQGISNIIYD